MALTFPFKQKHNTNQTILFPCKLCFLKTFLLSDYIDSHSKSGFNRNVKAYQDSPLCIRSAPVTRLYSVLKTCQRAVWSLGNTSKNIKFDSNSVYMTSSNRHNRVNTTFPHHIYSVHDASTARKKLLQRVHGAHTARIQRSHGDHRF